MKRPKHSAWILTSLLALLSFDGLAKELIAHRGVHQTYHRKDLKTMTCTATRIDDTGHRFMENTIDSMEEAFRLGATMVEIDVHPTTEPAGKPDELVVFHDWTLNCRTNATCENGCECNEKNECVTNQQSLEYVQSLDIGHGYTYDDGETYPFRGNYFGQVPKFEDVLDFLRDHPHKKILVNVKGSVARTKAAFLRIIRGYDSSIRSRVLYPYEYGSSEELASLGISDAIYQGGPQLTNCLKKYLLVGLFGKFPEECRDRSFFIMTRQTLGYWMSWLENVRLVDVLWGWPDRFIKRANRHGSHVYASQVDSIGEFGKMRKLDLYGIMTNKIELIAPVADEYLKK